MMFEKLFLCTAHSLKTNVMKFLINVMRLYHTQLETSTNKFMKTCIMTLEPPDLFVFTKYYGFELIGHESTARVHLCHSLVYNVMMIYVETLPLNT